MGSPRSDNASEILGPTSRPVLVTGSRGFSGRHLVEQLRGSSLTAIGVDQLPAEHPDDVEMDLGDADAVADLVARVKPSGVYHLAGRVVEPSSAADRRSLVEDTLQLTFAVLEAVASLDDGVRVLIASSSAVYGVPRRDNGVVEETDSPAPILTYGAAKLAQEAVALTFHRRGDVHVLITRAFNLTGPGERETSLLGAIRRQVAAGERVIRVGNTTTARDFIDVRDAASAYRVVMERGEPGTIYNVGTGSAVTIADFVERALDAAGGGFEVARDDTRIRAVDVARIVADNVRLVQLGWAPQHPLESTLRDVMGS